MHFLKRIFFLCQMSIFRQAQSEPSISRTELAHQSLQFHSVPNGLRFKKLGTQAVRSRQNIFWSNFRFRKSFVLPFDLSTAWLYQQQEYHIILVHFIFSFLTKGYWNGTRRVMELLFEGFQILRVPGPDRVQTGSREGPKRFQEGSFMQSRLWTRIMILA